MRHVDNHEMLARLIGDTLGALPLRRAPSGLQARVLAEIERRAARPWWRRSFMHWPAAARLGFVVASLEFVRLAIAGATWLVGAIRFARLPDALTPTIMTLQAGGRLASISVRAGAELLAAIPPTLGVCAAIAVMVLYAAVFGIGAAAFRTLYTKP